MSILLSWLTQPSFFASTKKALETSHGSSVSDNIVHEFIKNQFNLESEDLLPNLFNTSTVRKPISSKQLLEEIGSELDAKDFIIDWGNSSGSFFERSFESDSHGDECNINDGHYIDFALRINADNDEDFEVFIVFGKNFNDGEGMCDHKFINLDDIPGIINGDENIILPEHVTFSELKGASNKLAQIYNLFTMLPALSLASGKKKVIVATTEMSEPKPSVVDVTVVFTQDGENIHSWETNIDNLKITNMMEAVCNTGLVDNTMVIDYIVYDDKQFDVVLLDGSIKPCLLNLS